MRNFGFMRVILLALLVCLIPATSSAAVFISVGFAPPVLPVYVQPPCPEDGLMWTPGYWAYGDDGYYWVPGTWVPAPYVGALWTPGYWGWGDGLYVWHGGYWGPHVGYYGGVNYGFGYMGIGFAGGVWAGGGFRYNTAVMRVNTTVIHNTYIDNTVVHNTTVVNNHVAYSGGPGGVNHPPTADEARFSHEQHTAPTVAQTHHEMAARTNTDNYASHNGGHPANVATTRPLEGGGHGPTAGGNHMNTPNPSEGNRSAGAGSRDTGNRDTGNPGAPESKTYNASHSNTGNRSEPTVNHPAPEDRPAAQTHGPRPRPSPQPHAGPAAGGQSHSGGGGGEPHGGHEHGH
jgi:YXWGXW repeat-containing protein